MSALIQDKKNPSGTLKNALASLRLYQEVHVSVLMFKKRSSPRLMPSSSLPANDDSNVEAALSTADSERRQNVAGKKNDSIVGHHETFNSVLVSDSLSSKYPTNASLTEIAFTEPSVASSLTPDAIKRDLVRKSQYGNPALDNVIAGACAGNVDSLALLGNYYILGNVLHKNVSKGLDLVKTAATRKGGYACYLLSELLTEGKVVPPDPMQARTYLQLAAKYGDLQAILCLENESNCNTGP